MGLEPVMDGAARFTAFVEGLAEVIGHADRVMPLRHYCTGLLAAPGRKSVEPMAAVTAPGEVSVQHQKLLHFVANAPWCDERVLAKVREIVLPAIERHGPIEAWIIDDTSFPKHGPHSVGVQHQYCGQLGKQANCQVVVTLSIANHHASLPIAYRLYLPEEWAQDAARRKKAHIPKEIVFRTKPQIALQQLRAACAAGIPRGVVLLDASYGSNLALRTSVSALALQYVAAIIPTVKVRPVTKGGALGERMTTDVCLCARKAPPRANESGNRKLLTHGHQPADGQGARPPSACDPARARRRGDRINVAYDRSLAHSRRMPHCNITAAFWGTPDAPATRSASLLMTHCGHSGG